MSADDMPEVLVLYECPYCHVLMSEKEAALGACSDCFDYWAEPEKEDRHDHP